VGERLDEPVQPLGLFGERAARNVTQLLAGAFDGLCPLRVHPDSVLDGPQWLGLAEGSEHLGHGIGHRPLAVEVQRELVLLEAVVSFGGRFARHTPTAERRDLVDGELLAFAAPHRHSHGLDRFLDRPLGRARRDLAAIGSVVAFGAEVNLDGVAGA
jgi:hypothetical protein